MAGGSTTTSSRSGGGTTSNGTQIGPYIFGKTLGTGATGRVRLAVHAETKQQAAIKIVRKEFLQRKPNLKKKLQREITVMKLCNHPNVLRLLDVFEIQTHLFLVLEYVDGCELFEYLVKNGTLSPDEALVFFRQIIAGLEYCHKRLICHRDLKPENLLLDSNLNLKVADFGMTNLNPPGSLLETSCGSPHYAAPEVVSGDMYNGLEADIWSCGVILFAMVAGKLPFDDDNIRRLLIKVQRGVFNFPTWIDPQIKALIKGMMMVDPKKRLTIEEIKQNPWFNSIRDDRPFVDDFVAPEEPILNPNPAVMQGLVDLGWGDWSTVKHELATREANLEKVFYIQLERHPMFHKNARPEQNQRVKVEQKTGGRTSLSSLRAMMGKGDEKADDEKKPKAAVADNVKTDAAAQGALETATGNSKPAAAVAATAETTTGTAKAEEAPASSQADGATLQGAAAPSVLPDRVVEGEDTTASSGKTDTNSAGAAAGTAATKDTGIKNSPSLVRQAQFTGRLTTADIDIKPLTLQENDGNVASWFDTFRLYFIGGGGDGPTPA